MAAWDEEDYEVEVSEKPKVSDKWEGEDEDEDLKDAWDDDDEDDDGKEKSKVQTKKKKKSLKEIIAEKEAKQREEREERKRQEEEAKRKLTPEELLEEKLRQQKLQEDADLELAKQAFGASSDGPAVDTLDNFEPITEEDFNKYCTLLKEKFSKLERSVNYVGFLENLYRELAVSLELDEVKRLSSCLTAVYNEKNKAAKGPKSKKKGKGKATINTGKNETYADYTETYDPLDDFM